MFHGRAISTLVLALMAQTAVAQTGEVILTLSGQSFEGPAAYMIEIGEDRVSGEADETGQVETFFVSDPAEIRVSFTNDRYESRERDRNLLIEGLSVDGAPQDLGAVLFDPENAGRLVGERVHLLRNGTAILPRPETGWAGPAPLGGSEAEPGAQNLTPSVCLEEPLIEGCSDILSVVVLFGSGSRHVSPKDEGVVRDFARIAAEAACQVSVMGWSSRSGSVALNEALSLARADALAGLLFDAGLPQEAVSITGAGATDLFGSGPMNQRASAVLFGCENG